jgi:hypothetical protein
MTTTELTPCEQLAQALSAYQQSATDLEAYRNKASRAQADEEAALTSEVFSEHEIATRMGRAQNLKTVYATRIAHKESTMASQVAALEAALPQATLEFTGLLNTELGKRQVIVNERLLQATDIDESLLTVHELLALPQYTGTLSEFSRSIREISRLRPSTYWGTRGDGAAITNASQALLANLQQFKELTHEKL